MEPHQFVRPKTPRGTPARSILNKLGLAGIVIYIASFFVMDFWKGDQLKKKIKAGHYVLPEAELRNRFLLSHMRMIDMASAENISRAQEIHEREDLIEDSSVPNMTL